MGRVLRSPFLPLAFSFLGIVPAFSQAPLSVVYTGRTLGYFRYPEQQPRVNFDRCVDDPSQMSRATSDFLAALRKQAGDSRSNPAQLLVGMGDNFAMDLDSRTFVDKA